jgi:hypothetical protein
MAFISGSLIILRRQMSDILKWIYLYSYCRSNWSVPQILIQYITSSWPIHFIKFLEIFIHFLWKSQFQEFDHFWSCTLSIYDWLVAQNNKGDWCIQTIQQEVYNYTRKCMNISRNLMKWIGQLEVMYWINIWGTLQLERQWGVTSPSDFNRSRTINNYEIIF